MRKLAMRVAAGMLLLLVAVTPVVPVTGQTPTIPTVCGEFAFSTEEDFITHGPAPPDGNIYISDGDLLGRNCVVCARHADLIGPFDVREDLGLDAADVIDVEEYLVAFSTEMDSPNRGQFTAGDLLATNGVIIPNVALTYLFQIGYDVGLDAIHFTGPPENVIAFLGVLWEAQRDRDYWLENPHELPGLLDEHEIDIWFSIEGTLERVGAPDILDGDVLSARDGTVVAAIEDLLPTTVPAGIPNRGVDFGLDGLTAERRGDPETIQFSTEILYENEVNFTDGDVLRAGNGVIHTNSHLVRCFEPKADFIGLDALHAAAPEGPQLEAYLPLVLRAPTQIPR